MLEYILDTQSIELEPDQSLNLTLINPAFDSQSISRGYSYPVRIKHTARNLANIVHQHRLDTSVKRKYLPAAIKISGQAFQSGRAIIEEHTDTSTEATFQNNDLTAITALSAIKIRDLLGTIEITQTETAYFAFTPLAGPVFQVYINNVLYQEGSLGADLTDTMIALAAEINVDYPGAAFWSGVANELQISTLEEEFEIFTNNQFTLASERQLSEAREHNLQAFITSTVTTAHEAIAFPVAYNPRLYGLQNVRFKGYINWRYDNAYIDNQHYAGGPFWQLTYIPFVRLRYLFDLIAAASGLDGIVFNMDTLEAADLNSILLYNNYTLDQVYFENVLTDNLGNAYRNGFATSINLANHVPDYTADELITRITSSLNLHHEYQNNTIYITKNSQQVAAEPEDWTHHTSPPFQRTTTEGGGVVLKFDTDKDVPTGIQLNDYTVGDGSNDLTIPMRPVQTANLPNTFAAGTPTWKVAYIDQPGTCPALDIENEQLTLRLFFDRGTQIDADDVDYWLGSIDNLDLDGMPVGELSLEWIVAGSDTGIYTRFWRGWTGFLFSPIISRLCYLTPAQLLKLITWASPYIYIYHPLGTCRALVQQIQFKVSHKGIGPVKIDFQQQYQD